MRPIRRGEIQVGYPLGFNCYNAEGQLLLKKGLFIQNERQVEALIERGLYQLDSDAELHACAPERKSPFHTLDECRNRLASIFAACRQPEATDVPARVERLAEDVQALCRYDADAALAAVHLDHEGRYSQYHPLHVAILCECIAARQGLADEARRTLLCAALTANLALVEVQDTLQRQATSLEAGQQAAIRQHPALSVEMLARAGVGEAQWLAIVRQHHERLDGSGYPAGLAAEAVALPARILGLADTYCAMIAPRRYRAPLLARDALREIFLKKGARLDAGLIQLLIHELGVFPPGAFLKLGNGETAVVVRRGEPAMPAVVKAVLGPHGAPLPNPLVRDCRQPEFAIREMVPRPAVLALNLHVLWDYR